MMKRTREEEDKSESEDEGVIPYMFASALDVGSTFLDIVPEDDIKFRYKKDRQTLQGVICL